MQLIRQLRKFAQPFLQLNCHIIKQHRMTRLLKATFLGLSLLLAFSCSDEEDKLETDYTYVIEFGTECGWCAGTTTISVTKGEIEYTRIIPCGDDKGTIVKTNSFDDKKWEELITDFDTDYFETLEYNICNVCADGCDEIIKVIRNGDTHQIRYNPCEGIEGIESLQEKLRKYLDEFNENN